MSSLELGFFARLWLALVSFWRILVDKALAARLQPLVRRSGAAELVAPSPAPALQLLAIMQREGRLLDFLQEDVAGYSDAEIGAAVRAVHEGCRRGLSEYVTLEPVRPEPEGTPVVLEPGFDPERTRITGKVAGAPPFRGRLAHHGWQVRDIRLPQMTSGHDPRVVAPAEVEL